MYVVHMNRNALVSREVIAKWFRDRHFHLLKEKCDLSIRLIQEAELPDIVRDDQIDRWMVVHRTIFVLRQRWEKSNGSDVESLQWRLDTDLPRLIKFTEQSTRKALRANRSASEVCVEWQLLWKN